MKHATAELTGALLDAAVAKAEGLEFEIVPQKVWGDGSGITIVNAAPACYVGGMRGYFEPSTDWSVGGPLLERHWQAIRIELECMLGEAWPRSIQMVSPNTLPLFMRALVAAKLGPEVELP